MTKGGYRIIVVDGRRNVPEHRWFAEQHLGRALLRSETVHHRNGMRAENTIGPCFLLPKCECHGDVRHNLELWASAQPPGQRISDLVAFANEILARYGSA